MNGMQGLAYDATNHRLFGMDAQFHRVLVFDVGTDLSISGSPSYVLGRTSFTDNSSPATSSSTLNNGYGTLAYDSQHKLLFVGDTLDNRILAFNVDPAFIGNGEGASIVLGQSSFSTTDAGTTPTTFTSPYGVAYDQGNNRIWVADTGNSRILRFDAIKINTASLPAATVGEAYAQPINTANSQGTVSFTLSDGALPDGMVLGSVDGTPTAPGDYTFTVQANDTLNGAGAFFDDQTYTLTVNPAAAVSSGSSGGGGGVASFYPLASSGTTTVSNGESTASLMARLIALIKLAIQRGIVLPQSLMQLVENTGSKFIFGRDLSTGSTGEDVRQLQIFLNAHGFILANTGPGSIGNETTLFGGATRGALGSFQEAHSDVILAPARLSRGTGYFGQKTRNFVNSLP